MTQKADVHFLIDSAPPVEVEYILASLDPNTAYSTEELRERLLVDWGYSAQKDLTYSTRRLFDLGLADKARTASSKPGVAEMEEKGWTGFHMVDDQPILYDYVVKGFLKAACGAMRRVRGSESTGVRAYKKIIDGLLFVYPRTIPLVLPEDEALGVLERPLRAQMAQGPRVALARSDTCPVGTTMEFTLKVLGDASKEWLTELFDYGQLSGFGQWRSGGYGRFSYSMKKVD